MKKIISVIVVLAILAVGIFLGLKYFPAKAPGKAIASIVPQEVAFYYSVQNLQTIWDDIKDSRFWQEFSNLSTWNNLQVASGLQDLQQQFKENIGIDLNEENLMKLAGQELVITLTPGLEAATAPQIVIYCRSDKKQSLLDIVNPIVTTIEENSADRIEKIDYEKKTITHIKAPSADQPDIYFVISGDILAIAIGDSLSNLKKSIDLITGKTKAALADRANFKQIAGDATGDKKLAGLFFIDFTELKDYFQALSLPGPEGTPTQLGAGLDTLKYIGGWSEIKDGLVTKIYIYPNVDALDPVMKKMWQTAPEAPQSLRLTPENSLLYFVSTSLDLPAMWKLWQDNLIKSGAPEQSQAVLDGINNFETEWGIDLETDIFPLITEGLVPIPKLGLLLKIKDKAKTTKLIASLIEKNNTKAAAAAAAAQVPESTGTETPASEATTAEPEAPAGGLRMQINLTDETYEDTTIKAVQLPLLGTGLAPGYTYIDNFLVLGATTKTLQEVIDVSKGKVKPLNQDPLYQEMLGDLPKENNQSSYINTAKLMNIGVDICNWIISFQQLSIPQGPVPEDPDAAQEFNMRKAQTEATITTIRDNVIPLLKTLKALKGIGTTAVNKKDHVEQTMVLRVEDL